MADDVESEADEAKPPSPLSQTPHFDKLKELLNNHKLPPADKADVEKTIERYKAWIKTMEDLPQEGDERVEALVSGLNSYKRHVELELIWDSQADFLFRQRGQLKLDNSVIEEFLPYLVDPKTIPALKDKAYEAGPRTSFAAVFFTTTLLNPAKGVGLQTRGKDQDFTVGRTAFLQSSFSPKFPPDDTVTRQIYLAFIAAECKTNLDKTMFQEAIATAHDLKLAVPSSRYYLLCEWLDMTPISTRATGIDEVIILRGKRLASNVRSEFASSASRSKRRDWYEKFLTDNPIRTERVLRFVSHLRGILDATPPKEEDVLARGFF